jgi:hypothetical protein
VLRTHVIDGSRRGAMAAQAALAVDLAVARGQVCPEERVLVGGARARPDQQTRRRGAAARRSLGTELPRAAKWRSELQG